MFRPSKIFIHNCIKKFHGLEATERIVLILVIILSFIVFALIGVKYFTASVTQKNISKDTPINERYEKTADEQLKKQVTDRISIEFLTKHGNIKSIQFYENLKNDKTEKNRIQDVSSLFLILDPIIPYLADDIVYTESEKKGLTVSKTKLAGDTEAGISEFIYYELLKKEDLFLTVRIEVLSERAHEEKMTDEISQTDGTEKLDVSADYGNLGMMMIIIDDFGYSLSKVKKFEVLHPNLVYSILPLLPQSKAITEYLLKKHRYFMLHMPMESYSYPRLDHGPGVILTDDDPSTVRKKLLAALQNVNQVKGINNHMGSKLTENLPGMEVLFQVMAEKKLFFVDSKTTLRSVGKKLAKKYRVPYIERNVFLDDEQETAAIEKQFRRALNILKRKGFVVVIGHPFPETFKVLKKEIPLLAPKNISLITPKELFEAKRQN